MKLHVFLSVVCLLFSFTSCEKELDFKYHDIESLTVIEGEITATGAKVGITLTTPMDEPLDRTLLTDASVTLTDLTAGITYNLKTDPEGFFVDPTPGIVGHNYRLSVEREGCRYEADAVMYLAVEMKELEFNWIKMPYDYVAVLQCQFFGNLSVEGECYWVRLYRNGKIYRWGEVDGRSAVDGVNTYFTMTSRKDTDVEDEEDVLFDGDVIICTVAPVSRSMHDYLEALQNDSNGPFMFRGDKCLGYFIATSPVSESIVFHPDEIPEYK
ncbi:MAG: DUF4249 domain-containing protein [Paraprevotella sp.]|nr:DUF4249 domain-containing protein [Paraprevotella sp.]